MILIINTAQNRHELSLIEDGRVLAESIWDAARDDVDRLVPTLAQLLEQAGRQKTEIKEILVVRGPGSFTAVRTGVAFANALAVALPARLQSITTFQAMAFKSEADIVVIHAGGMDVAVHANREHKIGSLSALLSPFQHGELKVLAEVREQHTAELHGICLEKEWAQVQETQSLAEAIAQQGLNLAEPTEQVHEVYLKKPHIQKSNDKWKQA